MSNWYTARTKIGSEFKAVDQVKDMTDATFLPRYKSTYMHRGKQITRERPLAAGYLFIQIDLTPQLWHTIVDRKVIKNFIGGAEPTPVTESSMTAWVDGCDQQGLFALPQPPQPRRAKIGDKLLVNFGAFAGKIGICQKLRRGGAEIFFAGQGLAAAIYISSIAYDVIDDTDASAPQESALLSMAAKRGGLADLARRRQPSPV